jgi:hypothetical protein
MTSRTIITAAGAALVLEPTLSEFDQWNYAALAKRQVKDDWIIAALDSASDETPAKFTREDFPEGDPEEGRNRLVFYFSADRLERLRRAALLAEYPLALCRRIAGRTKPTRHSATLFLGAWAHVTLNRAAAQAQHFVQANVIPFSSLKKISQ